MTKTWQNHLFKPGDGKVGTIDGDALAVVLVSPTSIVSEAFDDQIQVDVVRSAHGLAVVQGLQVLFHEYD